jgi:large subunit ribosomal protein L24
MVANIKKGDLVKVIPARTRARKARSSGLVEDEPVIVEGVNRQEAHQACQPQQGKTGGIITVEAPIHVSNVMLVDPDGKQPTRVGFVVIRSPSAVTARPTKTERVRVSRKTGKGDLA